jgi:hypothetical protein
VASELDQPGRTDYDLIRAYFRKHKFADFDSRPYYDREHDRLTPLFYQNDRAMRESGFDPSSRFGPFGAEVLNHNPVCLKSLLYRMEMETAEILDLVGRGHEAPPWRNRAGRSRRSHQPADVGRGSRHVPRLQFRTTSHQNVRVPHHFLPVLGRVRRQGTGGACDFAPGNGGARFSQAGTIVEKNDVSSGRADIGGGVYGAV